MASEFGIPASSLSKILNDKGRVLRAVEERSAYHGGRDLEHQVFQKPSGGMVERTKRVRDYNLPISGPLEIQEKGAEFAKNLGMTFRAGTG